MFSKLHDRLGTAGFVLAIVALVAALSGAAYAAKGGLNKATKKQITKESKKWSKKYSKQFATPGPQGEKGATGANGANGKDGSNGANGSNGKSVTLVNENPGGCAEGGFTYEIEGSGEEDEVCNGEAGETGFTETLPPGKTETGAWALGTVTQEVPGFNGVAVPLSFSIPLAAEIPASNVHYVNAAGKEVIEPEAVEITPTNCLGTAAAPTAPAGHLCVYAASQTKFFAWFETISKAGKTEGGASTTGAILNAAFVEAGAKGWGTWAVTAPTP